MFNTTDGCLYYDDGTEWVKIAPAEVTTTYSKGPNLSSYDESSGGVRWRVYDTTLHSMTVNVPSGKRVRAFAFVSAFDGGTLELRIGGVVVASVVTSEYWYNRNNNYVLHGERDDISGNVLIEVYVDGSVYVVGTDYYGVVYLLAIVY